MDANLIKELVVDSINLNGLSKGILNRVLVPALDKVVADSSNTIDDAVVAVIKPLLISEIEKLLDEYVDLAKILKVEEVA